VAPNLSDHEHAAGNRQESETKEFDGPIGRVDTNANHQQGIDDHGQRRTAPGEGRALGLKTRIPHTLYWRNKTIAVAADSDRMQIDKTGSSLEYGSERECLIAISLALHRW
jgi:hypothetical protein